MQRIITLLVMVVWVVDPASAQSVFSIGNSLTWDAVPAALDGDVAWHVTCNKNLYYIYENPYSYCLGSSTPWTDALQSTSFDFVTVQPFTGTNLEYDTKLISLWMHAQPDAQFIIHTGWANVMGLEATYEMPNLDDKMRHSKAYYQDLAAAISVEFPDREIHSTHAVDLLYVIAKEIQEGHAPIDSLTSLFRDTTHLDQKYGRYLVHNALRHALGQPFSNDPFNIGPELEQYFNDKILNLEAELERVEKPIDQGAFDQGVGAPPSYSDTRITVTNTPEPNSLAVLLFAGGILLAHGRSVEPLSHLLRTVSDVELRAKPE